MKGETKVNRHIIRQVDDLLQLHLQLRYHKVVYGENLRGQPGVITNRGKVQR